MHSTGEVFFRSNDRYVGRFPDSLPKRSRYAKEIEQLRAKWGEGKPEVRTTRADGGNPDQIDVAFHTIREELKPYTDPAELDLYTVASMIAHCMKYADTFGVEWAGALVAAGDQYDDMT